jgi:hypothetical protein
VARPGKAFGKLEQLFDDVWWTWGTVAMNPVIVIPRTMVIVRERGELVVVHPVMMPPDEQAKIEALGPIKHIVRLGGGHGMDDPAYVAKYKPTTWATRDRELVTGGPSPFEGGTVLAFDNAKGPECVIHLPRHGGILLSCDSIQNWERAEGLSLLARPMTRILGFKGRAVLGPIWRKKSEPADGTGFKPTYDKIAALDFKHAIAGHGPPMKDTARDDLRAAIAANYR